jgi:hypothetical protein
METTLFSTTKNQSLLPEPLATYSLYLPNIFQLQEAIIIGPYIYISGSLYKVKNTLNHKT